MKEIQNDENNENKMKSPKDNVAFYLKKKEDEKNKIEVIFLYIKEKIKDLENQKKKIIKAISIKVEKKVPSEEVKKDSSVEKKYLNQNKSNIFVIQIIQMIKRQIQKRNINGRRLWKTSIQN